MQHVTITLDGGHTSINFAQAALLLQGTTSVYSKKIDFLWKLVEEMLEMLRNKKTREEGGEGEENAGGAGSSRGRRRNIDLTREFEYLTMDIGKNIDMKTEAEETETVKEKKDRLNFIYITPRQLVEKEGSEQKKVKVNLYTGVAKANWDTLAAKEDYRINSQYVMQTGCLGEDLNVDNLYLSINLVQEDTLGEETRAEVSINVRETSDVPEPDSGDMPEDQAPVDEEGEVPGHDVSVVSERAAGQNISRGEGGEMLASPPPAQSPVTSGPFMPEPVQDNWQPLDPHEQTGTPRPMKPKPTRRLPPSLMNKLKNKREAPLTPISEYLNQQMNPTARQFKKLNANLPPFLLELELEQMERRKALQKEERRNKKEGQKGGVGTVRRQIFDEDEEENDEVEQQEHEAEDFGPVGDGFENDDFDALLPDPHLGGDVGALVVGEVEEPVSCGAENDSLSYEELVARQVEEFALRSQEYMRSSELSKKVANWHEMIGPRLESLEKRKSFDVHAYGSKVINKCGDQQKTEVPFKDVIRGEKKEEVCR